MTTQSTRGSPIILTDGSEFPIWQDETEYRKVYYGAELPYTSTTEVALWT